MNSKALKALRSAARSSLKSSKLKGPFEREEHMRKAGVQYGATQKQVKRAVRVVARQFKQKPPDYTRRLLSRMVSAGKDFLGRTFWKNSGLVPV